MNKNLENAIHDIAKANGIAYAIEKAFGSIRFAPESIEEASYCINSFYALIDLLHTVEKDIERLEGDSEVVDILRASRSNLYLEK